MISFSKFGCIRPQERSDATGPRSSNYSARRRIADSHRVGSHGLITRSAHMMPMMRMIITPAKSVSSPLRRAKVEGVLVGIDEGEAALAVGACGTSAGAGQVTLTVHAGGGVIVRYLDTVGIDITS
jgi:hypothetical protein